MKRVLLLVLYVVCQVRTIKWTYNPGCDDNTVCGKANMLHVQADTQQYLWSTQNGLSGIIFSQNNSLSVNWTHYNNKERSVSVDTASSFGWDLNSVFIANKTHNQTIDLTADVWDPISIRNTSSAGSNLTFGYSNDFIHIQMLLSNASSRIDHHPSLKYNSNISIFDMRVKISGIPGLTIENATRATLGFHIASENQFNLDKSRSFDDEYSPGLFEYNSVRDKHVDGVYMMWRPVVYTSAARDTISQLSIQDLSNKTVLTSTLLSQYYSVDKLQTLYLDILPPDGKDEIPDTFFWTGCLGRGVPQKDTLSLVGTILILLIVGLPCLAIIAGSAVIIHKKRAQNSAEGLGYHAI